MLYMFKTFVSLLSRHTLYFYFVKYLVNADCMICNWLVEVSPPVHLEELIETLSETDGWFIEIGFVVACPHMKSSVAVFVYDSKNVFL
jgi:hypothetical protein